MDGAVVLKAEGLYHPIFRGISAVKMYKIPVSVLVIIHTPDMRILLLERADHPVIGNLLPEARITDETLRQTAVREVAEETGLDAGRYELTDWGIQNEYEIYEEWRWRYAPEVTRNTEHVFGLRLPEAYSRYCVPQRAPRFCLAALAGGGGKGFFPKQCGCNTKAGCS